jgi:hypothetical protein
MKYNNEISKKLKNSFKDKTLKEKVLDPDWLEKNISSGIDSTGFCRLSCEVIYKLFGGKDVWKVMIINKKNWEHGSHYYLENKETKEIVDVSKEQFENRGIKIPYELGKGTGLRSNPLVLSSKAKELAKHAGLI